MLAGPLPLFPLPRLVLLPGVQVGLHLFEPRYRAMARDAVEGGSDLILVRTRVETPTDLVPGDAATESVGTRVRILVSELFKDGRAVLSVLGIEAVRIEEVASDRPYRQARWEAITRDEVPWAPEERDAFSAALKAYLTGLKDESLSKLFKEIHEVALEDIPLLATALSFPHPEMQFLLEAPSLLEQARRLTALLAFAAQGRRLPEP